MSNRTRSITLTSRPSMAQAARGHLAAGDDKQAARLLTDAAYHTHDPAIERPDERASGSPETFDRKWVCGGE